MEFRQELADPATLSYGISDGAVLNLSTGARDCSISLGGPRNMVIVEVHAVSGGRLTRVRTIRPISVRVSRRGGVRRDMKLKTVVESALDIA